MNYSAILDKWAEYTQYDANQSSFNLLSNDYHLYEVGKNIELLLSEYDPSGTLAVIYIRHQFKKLLNDTKINLWKAVSIPGYLDEEKEMYGLLMGREVSTAHEEFIAKLNKICSRITEGRLIGQAQKSCSKIPLYLENVIDSSRRLQTELFKKGDAISGELMLSTHIHVFETLAQCLLALEKAKDGIYVCFINAGCSADCYFSFFIVSHGNILSINDRVDEAYIGQHQGLRNGRWTEKKADGLFPYDYIFKYSKYDYKGYASEYHIDES